MITATPNRQMIMGDPLDATSSHGLCGWAGKLTLS
jgi:hypothetical protein